MPGKSGPSEKDLAALHSVLGQYRGAGDHGEDVNEPVAAAETPQAPSELDQIRKRVNTHLYRNYGAAELHEPGVQGGNEEHTIR